VRTPWHFRCGLLHQNTTQHRRSSFERVLFVEPGHGLLMHNNVINGALNMDITIFTQILVVAARQWEESVKGTEPYETNAAAMIRRHPLGITPYVVGVPVIS
jgi:hypothetical protein